MTLRTLNYGNYVYSLLWVMQDFVHQPYYPKRLKVTYSTLVALEAPRLRAEFSGFRIPGCNPKARSN